MPLWTEEEREQRLDEVLAGYLQALKEGAGPGRQELLDSHPELADDLAAFFADQDRFDRLAAPLRGIMPGARLSHLRQFGDYEILEEIARGGMGVVFKAWQKSLGRVVALKMLLAGPWAAATDLQRFRTEAEAAAQLDHPNIVPIYGVGAYDGHPYLSMKLVEGGSLAHHLATAVRQPSDREAAALLATVADAIHYAHQRGILHRDLKPANILLQKRETTNHTNHTNKKTTEKKTQNRLAKEIPPGSSLHSYDSCDSWFDVFPLLTDFGLAKCAPAVDAASRAAPVGPASRAAPPEAPTLPLPQAVTHTGAILGTPGYMAPEQASGSPGGVTTAADVYGLGAILYEMLTGRPPFKAPTLLDTVRRVLEEEPVRPSVYRPALDRDLETICLKCLQKEPSKRYVSAHELADDLRRFLRGEAILARPIGLLGRTWRLARRRPLVSALTAALAVVLLGGLSSVLALWQLAEQRRERAEEHRERAEEHAREAQRHLQDAESSFRLANQAVHHFCSRVSDELRDTPDLQPLRKKLLEEALRYYKDFLARRSQDPALRRELAETYAQTARLTMDLGSRSDTRAAFRKAADLYAELQKEDPDDLGLQRKLGEILNARAIFEDSAQKSLTRLHEARTAYLRFLDSHPRDRALRGGLGIVFSNMGLAYTRMGRRTEAADSFRQGRDLLEQLHKDYPRHEGVQADLASLLANYAAWCNQVPESREEALSLLRRVLELRTALAEARPRNAQRQANRAAAHQNLGLALRDSGRLPEALHELQQAHDLRAKLARDNPRVRRHQVDLASSLVDLGAHHQNQNQLEQALNYFRQARDIDEKLFLQDPHSPYLRRDLALNCFRVGTVLGALNLRPEEHQTLTRARELQHVLVQIDPNNLDDRRDLSRTLNELGWNRMHANHPEETPPLLHEALKHMQRVMERAPHTPRYRETISFNWRTLAEAEKRLGHTRAAAAALHQCAKLWPDNPTELHRLARLLAIVADRVGGDATELNADEDAERRRDLDDALSLLRQAIDHGFRDAERLQKDKAFENLRSEEGFRALLRNLGK
jgi:eukaryotic-like serine/threonine-protein kinase